MKALGIVFIVGLLTVVTFAIVRAEETPAEAGVLLLDAPRAPQPDWSLPVRAGQTTYHIPRAALRRLVGEHPEWVR